MPGLKISTWLNELKKKKDIWSFSFGDEHFSRRAEYPRLFSVPVSEAAIWRCSTKKVFLKISQNSQEGRVSFLNKFAGLRLAPKKGLLQRKAC